MCGLQDYGDAAVGSLGIEHRKRTTIGVELAAKVRSFSYSHCHLLTADVAQTAAVLG